MRLAPLAVLALSSAALVSPAGRASAADDAAKPSLAIKVSQAGYLAKAAKRAFVVAPGDASAFSVRAAGDGTSVFGGRLSSPVPDADSGDAVRTADFSSLDRPGRYVLDVPGVGRSFEFAIGGDVLDRRSTLRCGRSTASAAGRTWTSASTSPATATPPAIAPARGTRPPAAAARASP
jgi:hypothetical protein